MFRIKTSLTFKSLILLLGVAVSAPSIGDVDELPESLAQVREKMNRANVSQARIVVAKDGAVVVLSDGEPILFYDRTGHHMHLHGSNPNLAKEIAERPDKIADVIVDLKPNGSMFLKGDIAEESSVDDRLNFYESIRDHRNPNKLDMVALKTEFASNEVPVTFIKILQVMNEEIWRVANARLHSGGWISLHGEGSDLRIFNDEGEPYARGNAPLDLVNLAEEKDFIASARLKMRDNGDVSLDGFLKVDQASRVGQDKSGLLGELTLAMDVPKGYGPKPPRTDLLAQVMHDPKGYGYSNDRKPQKAGCMLYVSMIGGTAALGVGVYAMAREVGKKKEKMREKIKKDLEEKKNALQLPGGFPPGWAHLSR